MSRTVETHQKSEYVFPLRRMVFFYLVTAGWIFGINFYVRIIQPNNQFSLLLLLLLLFSSH